MRSIRAISNRFYSTNVKEFLASHNPYSVTTYARPEDLVLVRGQGSKLWDTSDKSYIDFMGGIAVTGLGHSNPEISNIITDQSKTLIHASNLYYNEWTPRLAKTLVDVTRKQAPGKENEGFSRVFISNSGTEANEAALKFVRKWGKQNNNTNKYEVVSFKGSFHGRTFGSLTATANPKYQDPFTPLIPGFEVGELNDVKALETLITDRTCGVIIEPIQGEGGVNIVSEEFLIALRKRCNEVGALVIFDEIQCGLGRTGKLWAHEFLPSKEFYPDIITIAKALGNGYPIGATMVTEKVESMLKVGDHGTTYGGNPLGCRIGCYVVNEIARPEFLANVEFKSKLFIDRFEQLKNKYPDLILDIRGRGLLLGLKLSQDPGAIINNSRKNGLLVINCGVNTLRFVPAMNIPNELIKEGLDILEKSIEESI